MRPVGSVSTWKNSRRSILSGERRVVLVSGLIMRPPLLRVSSSSENFKAASSKVIDPLLICCRIESRVLTHLDQIVIAGLWNEENVANIDLVSCALPVAGRETELGLDDRAYLAGFQVKGRCLNSGTIVPRSKKPSSPPFSLNRGPVSKARHTRRNLRRPVSSSGILRVGNRTAFRSASLTGGRRTDLRHFQFSIDIRRAVGGMELKYSRTSFGVVTSLVIFSLHGLHQQLITNHVAQFDFELTDGRLKISSISVPEPICRT